MFQRKPMTLAKAATNMEYHQGAIIVYTSIGEELSCHLLCHSARKIKAGHENGLGMRLMK